MKKKKRSLGKIVEIAVISMPLIVFTVIGVAMKDTPLYSSEGIVIGTALTAFSIICWTGDALYAFFTSYRSIDGKIKKAIFIVFLVLLTVVSVFNIYLHYDYISLGKQANDIQQAAEEADGGIDIELALSALEKWGTVNSRKIIARLADLLYYTLFSVITSAKKRIDRESETETPISNE